MLSSAIDREYRERGIRTFSFRPGMVDTAMQEAIRASGINEVSRKKRTELLPASHSATVATSLALAAPADLMAREISIYDEGLHDRAVAGMRGA